MQLDRRSLLKATGAAAGSAMLSGAGAAETVDGSLDTEGDALQEVIVVFASKDDVDRLGALDLARGYHAFDALPMGYALLTGDQVGRVASWGSVLKIQANHGIEYDNDDAREVTGAAVVQNDLHYTGETVHAVVIDQGIDGDHPDFRNTLVHNYRFVNPLERETAWVDAGPADTSSGGHGTHVSGSVAGEGTASDGQYRGMAPDADLTVYSTDAGAALLQVLAAYDDMVDKQRRGIHDVQVVNNSYSSTHGHNYSPYGALQLATWEAMQLGITSVFSAGNAENPNTLSDYSIAPHVLCSAATDDDMVVTGFSSKGRKPGFDGRVNYDREKALDNLGELYSSGYRSQPVVDEKSWSGTVGPAADTIYGPKVETVKAYHEWKAPSDAGYLQAQLSWTPPGQDVDFYVHEGSQDGPVVAQSTGGLGANPEVVNAAVDPGKTYYLEVRPWANVAAQYEISLTARHTIAGESPSRPYSVHRPSVGTPGKFIMSTLSPDDSNQAYPTIWYGQGAVLQLAAGEEPTALNKMRREQTEGADDVYYGQVQGTSMSGPVLAGLVALIYDAYRQNHGEWPDPMDVINTVEATARDALDSHTTWNIGAGFADVEAAVKRAEAGDMAGFVDVAELAGTGSDNAATEPVFRATGSRSDDGDAYTAGDTVEVELTVDANADALVRDRIPFDWAVVGGEHTGVYTRDGERFVEFENVSDPAEGPATVSYFLEAPSASGRYEFGPAEARPASTASVDGSGFVTIAGTETNNVVGVSDETPL